MVSYEGSYLHGSHLPTKSDNYCVTVKTAVLLVMDPDWAVMLVVSVLLTVFAVAQPGAPHRT
jgi:hypothetical protein